MTTPAVPDRDDWFAVSEGFPRPDWRAIRGWMRAFHCIDSEAVWQQIVRHWLARLGAALGGKYMVAESAHFHFVTNQDEPVRNRMLAWMETAREQICRTLGEVAYTKGLGKHVVLRFANDEDYYRYISHHYSDGEHATSGGVFLNRDYMHIAFPESYKLDDERATLAHELVHNLLCHLPLPRWLEEALAMAFDGDFSGANKQIIDRDLEKEHRAYWNGETTQLFWAGRSFGTVEGQRVSYSLARILLEIIHRDLRPAPEQFRRFVLQSDFQDGGAVAAREQLECTLGELASVFLGEGDWEPHPERSRREDPPENAEGDAEASASDDPGNGAGTGE